MFIYLVNESGLNEKIKISTKKEKIKKIATKAELNAEQDKIVKLQTCDSSFLLVEVTLLNTSTALLHFEKTR